MMEIMKENSRPEAGAVYGAIDMDWAKLRVMGFVTTAFATSQVMGIPLGLYVSNAWGWHAPFLMIAAVSAVVGIAIFATLRPINAHLQQVRDRNPLHHLLATVLKPRHQWGFAATMLLALGGYMLMPFGSTFTVNNLGIPLDELPMIYMVTGVAASFAGPVVGRISDAAGKYRTFAVGSLLAIAIVIYYTHRAVTPLAGVMALNVAMFTAIGARQVSAQALAAAIPAAPDRGAYMSISSSMQQLAGGVASFFAGLLVTQNGERVPRALRPTRLPGGRRRGRDDCAHAANQRHGHVRRNEARELNATAGGPLRRRP
jgi:predicted MFS family arabinose efflux permease